MEEAPENGKELSHSAPVNGMNDYLYHWNTTGMSHLENLFIL
jgi:hypothetical protein